MAARKFGINLSICFSHLAKGRWPLLRCLVLLPIIVVALKLSAQEQPVPVPVATPLPVQLGKHVPMKKGERLQCHLLYPIYAKNQLVIPAGSVVRGSVIALNPDRSRRVHARLGGDFTPFHIPVVHFDQLVLPDGTTKQIVSSDATDGAPVLHLSTPAAAKSHSFISRQIAQLKQHAKGHGPHGDCSRTKRPTGSVALQTASLSPGENRNGDNVDDYADAATYADPV